MLIMMDYFILDMHVLVNNIILIIIIFYQQLMRSNGNYMNKIYKILNNLLSKKISKLLCVIRVFTKKYYKSKIIL